MRNGKGDGARDNPRSLGHGPALRLDLEARLSGLTRRVVDKKKGRRAAVALLVLADDRGRAAVVVTRRAANLRQHGGQFALPGGKVESGETSEEAALRELHEEVGVALKADAVLGSMDDYTTRSGFVITPVVVWGAAETELRPDPGEVAETYVVTLDDLGRQDTVQAFEQPGSDPPLLALAILGTMVFAPTAAILHHFAELAVHGRSTWVQQFGQPRFAWR